MATALSIPDLRIICSDRPNLANQAMGQQSSNPIPLNQGIFDTRLEGLAILRFH